ncbi:UPF0182 family protein [Virgibacillus sp. 179-BFC.A HS]|uniref:UPF0182 family protein n=1 Tax=Tigheibacillus jepli TaxID=3035914 RepID=A0ABU5CIC5_9BACI|nr:UPF0182 family protein [Virgibacillus sp. 179-BFC.A HS]MDY0406102.1 UPF0182 family protein [Virgibacillus sp. 179-BFC.A HS]
MDFRESLTEKQVRKIKKFSWIIGIAIAVIAVLLIAFFSTFHWITDYVWMDSLGFEKVYTTILSSKVLLGVAGFIVFAVATYFTLSWILRVYVRHFGPQSLPPYFPNKKLSALVMAIISIFIGAIGSQIVKGVGWEPTLKLLKHASFGKADPYFHMDVSFYMFILPFLKFVLFVLLGLAIFFLIIEIAAYSIFHIYRMSRLAQVHMGVTLGFMGILLAGLHVIAPYGTMLTEQVNIFQKSVVHGLSYTDKLINIPKSYVLAAVAIIGSIWMIVAMVRGRLQSMAIPIVFYLGVVILGQAASIVVQSFVVSPNEFAKEKPFLEHNLNYTRAAYDLDDIKVKENPGNNSLDEAMIKRNQLTIDNVRLNDSRPLHDIYNQLQTFRTYYQFNDMDIDRYNIDGNYQQVFIGARELSTKDLPSQAKTWVNRTLRYTHGYGVAMSHVNKVTSQGQPEYMVKNIPPEGVLDIKRPQIYFGEEDYPNVIVNSKVDEFDYPSGDSNKSNQYEARSGISLDGVNRLLFAIKEGSIRMLTSDQLTKKSQFLETRNIMDRVKRIAPFFHYDNDPYLFVRDDGTLAWMIDAYLKADSYPYAEPYKGNENYVRNAVKVVVDAYSGEVAFYTVNPDDPLLKTYMDIFPELFTTEIPDDVQAHFRYPEDLFKIQAQMYGTYHMSDLEVFYNREDYWQFPTEKYFNEDITMEPYYITMKLPEADKEEFILMQPYTPKKRQNMISWIGVRNDGEHYGEMFVYQFPKQKNIYGPQQIENRINQDSVISQQLNLWAQGGLMSSAAICSRFRWKTRYCMWNRFTLNLPMKHHCRK